MPATRLPFWPQLDPPRPEIIGVDPPIVAGYELVRDEFNYVNVGVPASPKILTVKPNSSLTDRRFYAYLIFNPGFGLNNPGVGYFRHQFVASFRDNPVIDTPLNVGDPTLDPDPNGISTASILAASTFPNVPGTLPVTVEGTLQGGGAGAPGESRVVYLLPFYYSGQIDKIVLRLTKYTTNIPGQGVKTNDPTQLYGFRQWLGCISTG